MVCIPCIVIPVLLYIWHRFFQPIFLKFWNPWKQVEPDVAKKAPSMQSLDSNACDNTDCSKTDSSSISGDESCDKISSGLLNNDQAKDKYE